MSKNTDSVSTATHGAIAKRPGFTQFSTRYDSETEAIWCWMDPKPVPCLNTTIISELELLQQRLRATYENQQSAFTWPFRYLVLASKVPGIYNLGGDLALFKKLIAEQDEAALKAYAHRCINLLEQNINNLALPIIMVALVQGRALGGGFEIALSCDTIIAERSAQLGFPEILFNLFPGMGAYNLLSRRVSASMAERIILSGKTYGAEELYEMGIVDVLAEDGEGEQTIQRYLSSHNRSHNTIKSMKKIRQMLHPVAVHTLYDIVDMWVEAAMSLTDKELTRMERLLYMQKTLNENMSADESSQQRVSRRGDWRKIKDVSFPLKTHLGEYIVNNRRIKRRDRRNP